MRIRKFNESTFRDKLKEDLLYIIDYANKLDDDIISDHFKSITFLKYNIMKCLKMLGSSIIPTTPVTKNEINELMILYVRYINSSKLDMVIDKVILDISNYVKAVKRSMYIYNELQDLIESADYRIIISNETINYAMVNESKVYYTFDINIFPKSDGIYNFTFKSLEELISDINAIKHRFSEITITHMLLTDMRIKFKTLVVDIP